MDNDVLLTTHVWGSPEPRQPHLRFGTDGRVTGSDGCNRLMGRWAFNEDDIDIVTLSQMASTMMFCEGVDDWLKRVDQVRLHPDKIVVSDGEGNHIGELARTDDPDTETGDNNTDSENTQDEGPSHGESTEAPHA